MDWTLTYNTALVLAATMLLGIAAGVSGSFVIFRRRALISDAVSHATLPGVAIGFLITYALGIEGGRYLPALLFFAAVTGLLAVFAIQWIRDNTRLHEDTATGSVLSVFYGAGIVLLGYIQTLPGGSRAGLDSFLLGQAAAMNMTEAVMIAVLSALILFTSFIFFKPFAALCFDENHAASCGLRTRQVDLIIMGLMLASVCVGLKTVGLILIVALLIIPPAAARLWTNRLSATIILAGFIGAVSACSGTLLSALHPSVPTGAAIVLSATATFFISAIIAPHGVMARTVRHG